MKNLFSFGNKLYLCPVNNKELMNYPLISEYVEAIKAAEDNFEQLKHLRPVLGEDGEPVMTSGNFAVVFKMKDEQTGKLHAVKCFLKEQEGRAEAYRQIAEELEFVSSTFLTPIKYLDKELFVDSANSEDSEFPVLLMDWVEGQTLDKYIREHIDDQYELSLLAYQFSRLAMWLMPQPFAHGDLKPDNILVKEDGTLVLVDYDGMYVPAMKGQKARELGSPDFRHPGRTEEVFDDHIDDFSLASILLSLKAISLQPSLLEEYGASDRLLFSENDYRNLSESSALGALQPLMQDAELASLYSLYILALSQNNLSQVSFRLFNLSRPDRSQYEEENLSTEVTKEDLANAWTDEFGVKYSADRKRLLKAPRLLHQYSVRKGTKVICDKAFLDSFKNDDSSIIIPDGVQKIGKQAFCDCTGLDDIVIPDSVVEIGKSAFEDCQYLTSITLSQNLMRICEYAFKYCIRLPFITLPNNVKKIGDGAFINCWEMTAITIPRSVKSVGSNLFGGSRKLCSIVVDSNNRYYDSRNNCNAIIETTTATLVAICSTTQIPDSVKVIGDCGFSWFLDSTSFVIPDNIIEIGDSAFESCEKLSSVVFPDSLKHIGRNAFKSCGVLSSVSLPESIISIGEEAFCFCRNLKRVNLPKGLEKIGDGAFSHSGLVEVKIPKNVKEIGVNPFGGCSNLTSIMVDHENKVFDSRNNCQAIIETESNNLISACSKTLIPNGVRIIGKGAFDGSNITAINIPDSVIEIGNYAFSDCYKLTSIVIPESVTKIGSDLFGWGTSQNMISITLPKNVMYFGTKEYFEGSNSSGLTFKDIMEIIGGAFYVGNIETIYIPKGAKEKYKNVFPYDIDKLVELDSPDITSTEVTDEDLANAWTDEYGVIYSADKKRLLYAPEELENYSILKDTIIICENAFSGNPDFSYYKLNSIYIPNSVRKIGSWAFRGCSNLTSINIPDSIIDIGYGAFSDCDNLTSIIVDDDNVHFDSRDNCNAVIETSTNNLIVGCKATVIPDSVRVIGALAFSGSGLTDINIPDSVKVIGFGAFNGCYDLESIIIPSSIKSIGDNTFYGCHSLDEIVIPSNVKSIGANAFSQCLNLKKVWFSAYISNIDPSAFIGCRELECIFIPDFTFDEFEKLLPKFREVLMEEVTIENHKGHRRIFCKKEIDVVNRAIIVQGQYTKLVCFYMNDGCQKYIPLCKQSNLSIGDEVDLNKAKLIEFNDEGIYYGLHVDGYDDVQKYLVEA